VSKSTEVGLLVVSWKKTQPGLTTKGGSHIVNENNRVVATARHVFNSVARPAVELFVPVIIKDFLLYTFAV
jgi:hypothetical protein